MFKKLLATAILSAAAMTSAHAAKSVGDTLYVYSTGDVTLTYLGASASAEDILKYGKTTIFNNKTTAVGTTFDLGTFAAGTELTFTLLNKYFGFKYYTGSAADNPQDGTAHAAVTFNDKAHTARVGFEDILFGGDKDYNDLIFRVSNVTSTPASAVPEADSWALMLAGLVMTSFVAARRKKINSGK